MKFDLLHLNRRYIYLFVLLAVSIPLVKRYSVQPARMKGAEKLFDVVQNLSVKPGDMAFIAPDFGPGMAAESLPQAEVVVEHLMRRRIPVVFFSLYVQAEPFLESIPRNVAARLMKEQPNEKWEYGKDWVNLGFRSGGYLLIQSIPKSDDLAELFKRDTQGNNLADLPAFRGKKTLENISLLVELTGLQGMLDIYIQFFQKKEYRPTFAHGCTSIVIPEAFVYLDSGQISGLLEGIAGAAWYSVLLKRIFPDRPVDSSLIVNTGLGVAHLVIIAMIVLGNITALVARRGR